MGAESGDRNGRGKDPGGGWSIQRDGNNGRKWELENRGAPDLLSQQKVGMWGHDGEVQTVEGALKGGIWRREVTTAEEVPRWQEGGELKRRWGA